MTKAEFELKLNCSIVGETQAKRNRTRIIKKLGNIYHQYAGKLSLYEMYKIEATNGKNNNHQ